MMFCCLLVLFLVFFLVFAFSLLLFFFCADRRRHTMWPRDCSSDVCSSDLDVARHITAESQAAAHNARVEIRTDLRPRSEERRVGKECRTRGSPQPSPKK